MGLITKDRSDYIYVNTVFTAPGKLKIGTDQYRKARLWVLEDRTVIAVVPGTEDGGVWRRNLGLAERIVRTSRRELRVELAEDPDLAVEITESDCGCGMGYVASAGPVLGKWKIVRVRRPDWFISEV